MLVDRADLEASLARIRADVDDPRAGIHGPGSAAWHLQRDAVIFLGGGRAALMQLAHPFVAQAIADHSRTRDDVVGRFRRTFDNVFAMSFGDLDHAFTAARRVHDIHSRITGTLREPASGFPAGTPYHANHVHGLLWVHATLIDTVVTVHETLHGPLPAALCDAYYRDSWAFARLFGIPDEVLPPTWAAFGAYVERMIPKLTVITPAAEMARFLFGGPLGRVTAAVTALLLPAPLRAQFGLRAGPVERALGGAALTAARAVTAVTPASLRDLPAYRDARRRLRGLPPSPWTRWIEARLFALASRSAARAR